MPNTKPVPNGVTKTEPAVTIGGSVSAIMLALFATLKAFGVPITEDMSDGLNALVAALCAIPAVSGWLTRFFVYSPASVTKAVNSAAETGDATIAPPPANGKNAKK